MTTPDKVEASWDSPKVIGGSASFYHNDIIELRLTKFSEKFTAKFNQIADTDKSIKEHVSSLVLIPKGKGKKKGIRDIDLEASKFTDFEKNSTQLSEIESQKKLNHPFLHINCRLMYRIKKHRTPLSQPIRLPIDVGKKNPNKEEDIANVKLELIIEIDGKPTKPDTIIFQYRQVSKQRKFLDFLKWQYRLLYGPSNDKYDRITGQFSSVREENWHLFRKKKGKLKTFVSGTANNGQGSIVCSPLGGMFLAYWLNYNQYYTPSVGKDRYYMTNPTGQKIQPRDNKYPTKLKKDEDGNVIPPQPNNNGYGNFLELELKSGDKRQYKNLWENLWDVNPKSEMWGWLKFYNEFNSVKPGTIFVCSMVGHVFLVVKFGDKFNFPQKYILNNNKGELCKPGLYKIHANGPGPSSIKFKDYIAKANKKKNPDKFMEQLKKKKKELEMLSALYALEENKILDDNIDDAFDYWKNSDRANFFTKKNKKKFEAEKDTYSKANIQAKRAGTNLNAIAKILLDAKNNMSGAGCKIFNGTPLVLVNGRLEKKTRTKKDGSKEDYIVNECGIDGSGQAYKSKQTGKFWVWSLKNIIDDTTGLIKAGLPNGIKEEDLPNKMWYRKKKVDVDLRYNDCRTFIGVTSNEILVDEFIRKNNIVPRKKWGKQKPKYDEMERDWDYDTIVIHHSGNWGYENPEEIEEFHMIKRNFADVGYHYLIDPKGIIYEGRRLLFVGAHTISNKVSKSKIGIIVLGDFQHQWWDWDDDDPTKKQLDSVEKLIVALKDTLSTIVKLGGHRDWDLGNECPGDALYKHLNYIRSKTGLDSPSAVA